MKQKQTKNGMYAMLLAAAVLVVGSIWYACSADYESESDNFKLTDRLSVMTLDQAKTNLEKLDEVQNPVLSVTYHMKPLTL